MAGKLIYTPLTPTNTAPHQPTAHSLGCSTNPLLTHSTAHSLGCSHIPSMTLTGKLIYKEEMVVFYTALLGWLLPTGTSTFHGLP